MGTKNIAFSVKQDANIDYYMYREDNENQKMYKFTYLSTTVKEGSVHALNITFMRRVSGLLL